MHLRRSSTLGLLSALALVMFTACGTTTTDADDSQDTPSMTFQIDKGPGYGESTEAPGPVEVFCVQRSTTEGIGTVYIQVTGGPASGGLCEVFPKLSRSEFFAMNLTQRCHKDSDYSVRMNNGGVVSVYSDDEPINVETAQAVCK